ncbi:hypothetical protein L2E82_48240 [Cichorium intybus]|uniref:Uncharacterized protein n=1 Tax=Cichorium intybus TaxID=13427 RepID=A0ACB8YXU3_CICIN|nr:hypothetical protein L2E82_48240 [Cichorium intybus]
MPCWQSNSRKHTCCLYRSFYGDATPRHDEEEKDENRNDGEDDDEVTVSEVPPPSFKARRRNVSKYFKSPFTQMDGSGAGS